VDAKYKPLLVLTFGDVLYFVYWDDLLELNVSAAANWDRTSFKTDVGLGGAALGDMHMCFRAELAKIQCVEQHRHEREVGIERLWQTSPFLECSEHIAAYIDFPT